MSDGKPEQPGKAAPVGGAAAPEDEEELFLASMEQLGRLSKSKMVRNKQGAVSSAGEPSADTKRGATHRLERRMRRRDFEPDQRIDLHGLDRRAAQVALARCLESSSAGRVEFLLVIHGKGRRILEQLVCRELDRHASVAEHFSAPSRLGGSGARVVRLRRGNARSGR